jgi:hypothetical protein
MAEAFYAMPSGMIVHDQMLHEKQASRWIGLPSKERIDKNGVRRFTPMLGFASRDLATASSQPCSGRSTTTRE